MPALVSSMQAYQVILLIAACVVFCYLAVLFYVTSKALDFRRSLSRKREMLSLIQLEMASTLLSIDSIFKSASVTYSKQEADSVDALRQVSSDKKAVGLIKYNASLIVRAKSSLSYLALSNKWATKSDEFRYCQNAFSDLERFFRTIVALYNADIAAYDYYRRATGFKLLMYFFGFKAAEPIG